jgi:argininosuccinate lyase
MPQKKNPDPLELTRAKVAIVVGDLVGMFGIVKALPSGYSRDLQDLKPSLLDSSATVLHVVRIMSGIVGSIRINKTRMYEVARTSYAIAVDIAEQLVTRHKIPFRSAHKIVGALVNKAISMGNIPLAKLQLSDIASSLQQLNFNDVDANQLLVIIHEMTPERSLEIRKSSGSPNLKEQEEMIQSLSSGISNYKLGISKRAKMVDDAFDSLAGTVASFL